MEKHVERIRRRRMGYGMKGDVIVNACFIVLGQVLKFVSQLGAFMRQSIRGQNGC
jgi:hypothetical protein